MKNIHTTHKVASVSDSHFLETVSARITFTAGLESASHRTTSITQLLRLVILDVSNPTGFRFQVFVCSV